MKISEISENVLLRYIGLDDIGADDRELVFGTYLPAAIQHLNGLTGLTETQMDTYDDLSIAVMALVSHMYENRGMQNTSGDKTDMVVNCIVEKYRSNLLPETEAS